jgi:hypothetical protein
MTDCVGARIAARDHKRPAYSDTEALSQPRKATTLREDKGVLQKGRMHFCITLRFLSHYRESVGLCTRGSGRLGLTFSSKNGTTYRLVRTHWCAYIVYHVCARHA